MNIQYYDVCDKGMISWSLCSSSFGVGMLCIF